MSTKKAWSEEEREKAIKAFLRVHPGWNIASNQYKCPTCHRRFYCPNHKYAYRKWLSSIGVPMLAIRDPELKEELKREV